MGAPKNFYNTVDQRKLGLDEMVNEINELNEKVDDIQSLPDVTSDDDGKYLTVTNGEWSVNYGRQISMLVRPSAGTAQLRVDADILANEIYGGKPINFVDGTTYEVYKTTICKFGSAYNLVLTHEDYENNIIKKIVFNYNDASKRIGTYTEAPFESAGGTGDIDWERELVDEWDFTKSLTSKNNRTFTIESGAEMIDEGLWIKAGSDRVWCDLAGINLDWNNCDIEIDCDPYTKSFNRNNDYQLFAFYNTGFSNYSLGPKWRNAGVYAFANSNREPLYGCAQVKFLENLCLKCEHDESLSNPDGIVMYGRGMLLTPIVNPVFSSAINEVMATANSRVYIGSGYNDWSPVNMVIKGFRIYRRTN